MDDLLSELWACLENQGADGFLIRGAEIRQRTTVRPSRRDSCFTTTTTCSLSAEHGCSELEFIIEEEIWGDKHASWNGHRPRWQTLQSLFQWCRISKLEARDYE